MKTITISSTALQNKKLKKIRGALPCAICFHTRKQELNERRY